MKTQILLILFLTLLIPNTSSACECPIPKSLELVQNREFENSDCILIGEVLEINPQNDTFKVKVIESFNGDENGKVYNGIYNRYCEAIIDQKGKWLIYGNIDEQGLLEIKPCGLTRSFTNPENNFQVFVLGTQLGVKPETDKEKTKRIKKAHSDLINEIEILRSKR
ncbi:hypothetical protein [Mesoflavibacter zeaxanthinifaciens]|uniref:hypothetical protein n=1 Tax=Mesoflavibacter zeaxanthinifaciens TaxID=393060 RepID=UPI003A9168A4